MNKKEYLVDYIMRYFNIDEKRLVLEQKPKESNVAYYERLQKYLYRKSNKWLMELIYEVVGDITEIRDRYGE